MSEEQQTENLGRVEVAPEVLTTIAHFATTRMEGVRRMAAVPPDVARLFRRSIQHDGILLNLTDDQVKFDIYVIMEPDVNIMETSRALQTAVVEAIDTMVGIPVNSVNIHVEDVVYTQE
ncbi:MAG: Asp23/Gls24 family envelope stress response protein [Ardenticatenaceae bacterium]|nr:Asp23/Gls24 family envelope stress response protein [Anaerolineales bacterium]MCB8923157.1 Asp23/Gls24 family envelope stress response protein [Ardenticatenaceae bacterium]MCB9005194.1 Asp23/Gls24 family envelope stress response protein [Ardenticatenaceae bacterium]